MRLRGGEKHVRLNPRITVGITSPEHPAGRRCATFDVRREICFEVARAQIGERASRRGPVCKGDLGLQLHAGEARTVEVRAHEDRKRGQRHEHGAVRRLGRHRLAGDRRADRAGRENQCLLLNVALDIVRKQPEICARTRRTVADTQIDRETRLGFNRCTGRPVDFAPASAVEPTKATRPSRSGAATSKPEPVSPSVPRSVMCGAR